MLTPSTLTTGNLWFVLPRITPPPGGIDRLAFLTMGHRGLVELTGGEGPFLSAGGEFAGRPLLANGHSDHFADWIPTYASDSEEHRASLTWLAPHDERGWLGRLAVQNRAAETRDVVLWFKFRWAATRVSTYDSEPLAGHLRLLPDGWGGGVGLDWIIARTEFGLGVGCSTDAALWLRVVRPDGTCEWEGDPTSAPGHSFAPGRVVELECRRDGRLAPGEEAAFELFASVAPTARAACLNARCLRELGWTTLFDRTRAALERMQADLPAALAAHAQLGPLVRRNRLFCYFYSVGRTLDTEELCPVTSRSSDYHVSAAYWDRDALLWSFPTLLSMDRELAEGVLAAAYGRQARNIGLHSRFIDGTLFEPGFELDELVAPVLALDRYLRGTGDWSILERIAWRPALRRIERLLAERRHPDIALFSTDYLPTDDRAREPYCTYDNVLVWAACGALERLCIGTENFAAARQWAALGHDVAAAIRSYGVVSHAGRRQYAWTVDLRGGHRLYDEPPGSLVLLAALGFVSEDDPEFRATCDWIYSPANPFYFPELDEIGCQHEAHPWVLAVANSLRLSWRRPAALQRLMRLPMDDGLACEAVHERTGMVVSGRHFAACAGFLCDSLVSAFSTGPEALPDPATALSLGAT